MSSHISNSQIISHIQSASSISVNGKKYKTIKVSKKNITIGPYVFPIEFLDVAGVDQFTFHFVDDNNTYHELMLLDKDGIQLKHPTWELEAFDPSKIKSPLIPLA